ncbi:MAG TPA: redoxin domain-containing protein [Chthoniobacterales bacterium]|nr:redoxin domain-containing protein [Chthoniobacterales bacterium]
MDRRCHTFRVVRLLLVVIGAASLASFASRCGESSAFDLAGNPIDPLKLAAGKIVVLVFVRTDCPVSNRYAPTIQRLSAEHTGTARFWLVYPSKSESAEAIRKHEQEYGYKISALRDPQHVLVRESHVEITPEAAVFDASRHLVYHGRIDNLYEDIGRARSAPTTHELEDAMVAALAGKSLSADAIHGVGCYISDLE